MSGLARLRTKLQHADAVEAMAFVGLTVAQRLFGLHLLQVIEVTPPHLRRDFLTLDARFRAGFASRSWLLAQAKADPDLEMTPQFVTAALDRGDRCYVVVDGERIASYGWYSCRPTPIFDGFVFCFDPAYTYMYKGYTRPEYRGLRLHATGMSRALAESCGADCRGLVSFVECTNLASLKSCYRMGYTGVTKIALTSGRRTHLAVRLGGRDTPEVTVRFERELADAA